MHKRNPGRPTTYHVRCCRFFSNQLSYRVSSVGTRSRVNPPYANSAKKHYPTERGLTLTARDHAGCADRVRADSVQRSDSSAATGVLTRVLIPAVSPGAAPAGARPAAGRAADVAVLNSRDAAFARRACFFASTQTANKTEDMLVVWAAAVVVVKECCLRGQG